MKATGKSNSLIKFSDDCTLLVPANTDVSAENELSNIIAWSVVNKLALNLLKTKETVFHRPLLTHLNIVYRLLCQVLSVYHLLNCLVFI